MNQLSCYNDTYDTKQSRMDQVKFVEDSLQKILLAPFLNTVSHITYNILRMKDYITQDHDCFV